MSGINPAGALSLTAFVVLIVGYVLYLWNLWRGDGSPNPISWLIWVLLNAVNVTTLIFMNQISGGWQAVLPATAHGLSCLVILVYAMYAERTVKVKAVDYLALVVLAAAVGILVKTGDASAANVSLQTAEIAAFFPTMRGLLDRTSRETVTPWLLFSAGYLLNVGVVIVMWDGQLAKLVYPLVGLCTHAGTAALAIRNWRLDRTPSA